MPVFNPGIVLKQALRSVADQTWRDRELVVVDDGSTDATTLRLLEEAAEQSGVSVHRRENGGPARARNQAIELAGGAYVLPLDADDYLAPTFLERTVPILEAEPGVAIVHTWVGLVGGHHGVWRTGGFSVAELLARCTVHTCSLYRRTVWQDVGGYDPSFVEGWEDWDFWLTAAAHGWQARGVPEVLAYYRRGAGSRERAARAPGTVGKLMRQMVAKHRGLYETHPEEAMARLYEEFAAVCGSLERLYDHPVLRTAMRLRALLRRGERT
jgi:glycosyltransferase involved in cell wall biosynthesis